MSLLRIVAAVGALLFAGVFAACGAFDRGDPVPLRAGATSVSNAQTCLTAQFAAPDPPDGVALQGYDLVVVTSDATQGDGEGRGGCRRRTTWVQAGNLFLAGSWSWAASGRSSSPRHSR